MQRTMPELTNTQWNISKLRKLSSLIIVFSDPHFFTYLCCIISNFKQLYPYRFKNNYCNTNNKDDKIHHLAIFSSDFIKFCQKIFLIICHLLQLPNRRIEILWLENMQEGHPITVQMISYSYLFLKVWSCDNLISQGNDRQTFKRFWIN